MDNIIIISIKYLYFLMEEWTNLNFQCNKKHMNRRSVNLEGLVRKFEASVHTFEASVHKFEGSFHKL